MTILIVKRYMTAEIKVAYLNKLYELREDDLLGAAYSEIDNVTGKRQTVSTESLAIDLSELSGLHDKKLNPMKKDIVIFNQTLKLFSEQDQINLYYAINNEDDIFTSKELQLIIMRFGTFIEDDHHVEQDIKGLNKREQYINKLITKKNDKQLVV